MTPRKTVAKAVVENGGAVLEVADPSDTFQIAAQKLQSVSRKEFRDWF